MWLRRGRERERDRDYNENHIYLNAMSNGNYEFEERCCRPPSRSAWISRGFAHAARTELAASILLTPIMLTPDRAGQCAVLSL
jgi:hypothetical protein